MNRTVLGLGLVVLVGAGLAWYLMRGGGTPVAPGTATSITPAAPPAQHVSPPSLPALGSAGPAARVGSDPRDYSMGGVEIRDHRADAVPVEMAPNLHAPDARRLPPTVVASITDQVKQVLYACAGEIPREARGEHPRMESQVKLAITGHKVTVVGAEVHLKEIVGAALEPSQKCIEDRALALTAAAPEEADLASYTVSVSYLIP